VLLAGEGMQNKQIAEQLGISTRMAALWRGRFIERGIEGVRPGNTVVDGSWQPEIGYIAILPE
jgi:transposase